jgi:AraC family transcriptional regulator of adaptative response / DNA-3-methyladenine glycosylase II
MLAEDMDLDRRVCDRARRSRDARFDGRFFIGVTSTGIYCRPICPARAPKDEHVRYFPTAAAAEAAGFRPCLRCRPEAAPGTSAWHGTSGLVSRALRLISEGALDADGVERLADRLGVTARHLRRLFLQHLGATPLEVALTRRAHFAKKLLDETTLAIHHVAIASGFGSVRRFNSHVRRTYGRTPTELRRIRRQRVAADPECYRFRLAYRPPYNWDALLAFLGARATPGVECVSHGRYRRTIDVGGTSGVIAVSDSESGAALNLEVRFPHPGALLVIVERVRRMFDLGADPSLIEEQLGADRLLRPLLAAHQGIRTPGAWDGFELAVRAVVGQQISVRAATTVAGRLAAMFGSPVDQAPGLRPQGPGDGADGGDRDLERLFPSPAQLASAAIERAGVMPSRAHSIRALARQVLAGSISFGPYADAPSIVSALKQLPGIGSWTAAYIAMRALSEPDAFPSGDLVLRRMAGNCTARELDRRAELWRPWRAYAAMLLWQGSGSGEQTPGSMYQDRRDGVTESKPSRRIGHAAERAELRSRVGASPHERAAPGSS